MSHDLSSFSLEGRVAIVTGGNGGIGLGMARGLARAGASVAVAGRDAEKSAAAVAELQGIGGRHLAVEADVTDEASVTAMVEQVASSLGPVRILVNNAGINIRNRPEKLSLDDWQAVLDTNVSASFVCARACYPHMRELGAGKVINNGSMLSIFGTPWAAPYAASKGGVVQLTKALATAWAAENIQVNCILPGWIDTAMTRQARIDVPGLEERVTARTPAGRWGEPEHFAGIAAFLASDASDFVTGTAIPVDGGYSVMG